MANDCKRPTRQIDWATNTNYVTGPMAGTATKEDLDSIHEEDGGVPGKELRAQYDNRWRNDSYQWQKYLDGLPRNSFRHGIYRGFEVQEGTGAGVFSVMRGTVNPSLAPSEPIIAFADAGSGKVTVTSTGHGLNENETITISGTTNYNGTFEITDITDGTFSIVDTWAGDDATGDFILEKEAESVFITPSGYKVTEQQDFVDFNSGSPASAYNPTDGSVRKDAISLSYDASTQTSTMVYTEDIDSTEIDKRFCLAIIVVQDSATFTVDRIVQMSRMNPLASRIYVGDGVLSNNVDVIRKKEIQYAIDYLNLNGGGTLDISGFMFEPQEETEIQMKSGVTVRGNGMGMIRGASGDSFVFGMEGAPFAGATVTAAGKLTIASGDFYDYGIGSRIEFTAGANSGTIAYIYKIDDELNAWMVDEYKQFDTFSAESAAAGFDLLLADAGICWMGIDGSDLATTCLGIYVSDTYNCFIDHCVLENSSREIDKYAVVWQNRNENFKFTFNDIPDLWETTTSGLIGVSFGSASTNTDWVVVGNSIAGKALGVGVIDGLVTGNNGDFSGWISSDAGWQTEPETTEHNTDGSHKLGVGELSGVARYLFGISSNAAGTGYDTSAPCKYETSGIQYISIPSGDGTYADWYVEKGVTGNYAIRCPHTISGSGTVVTLDYDPDDLMVSFIVTEDTSGSPLIGSCMYDSTTKIWNVFLDDDTGTSADGTWYLGFLLIT